MANNWNYGDSYFDGNSYKTRAQAFAAARKNGRGVFTYKGKQYNTMQKGENADEFRRAHADYDYFLGNVAKDQGGWKPSDPVQTSYKVNDVPDIYTKPIPENPKPQTPARTKLSMFTNDDIRNLGFRNYAGMVSAIGNQANANNNFVKAMIDRYGPDTSKWNQNTIENDLGVKGTYRSFGGGDFGDMSRAMAGWVGQNNGEIDRQDLQSRTGSDGVVYSNSRVKDLFDKVQLRPKTFTFDTSSFGTNLFGTPKKQQGGQLNMNEQQLQQAFLQYLMQKTGAQDEQQLEQVVQQLGEDGLKQAYTQFIQEMQQQQVQAAKFGAKLNYIKKLNGQCPDGYELQYYKSGGQLCKKCMKKQVMQDGEYLPQDPIDQFKCGRKIKKKKCEAGGTVNLDKCGAKMKKKKCEDGGIVNIDKCGAKIKKKKCEAGGTVDIDKCGAKIKKNQKGGSFNTAWNKARTAGNRYFWFNGRTYNTKKKGESDAYWAKHFKDNATSGGANNIQTDVGLSGGWKGVKGANIGRYNSKGQWIRSKQSIKDVPKNAVYGARGDSVRQSDYKIFAPIDKPKTAQTIGSGSNKGTKTTNGIITVGNKIPDGRPLTFGGVPYKVEQSTSVPNLIFQGGFNSANPGNYWVNPLTPGFETKR